MTKVNNRSLKSNGADLQQKWLGPLLPLPRVIVTSVVQVSINVLSADKATSTLPLPGYAPLDTTQNANTASFSTPAGKPPIGEPSAKAK